MEELLKLAKVLDSGIKSDLARLNIVDLTEQLSVLDKKAASKGFWNDRESAQKISKQQARLREQVEPWLQLKKGADELLAMLTLEDESLTEDLKKQYSQLNDDYQKLKQQAKMSGPYDSRGVILEIYAGAGGNDAQDWASMLQRMYLRWAQKQGYKTRILSESTGEEAGIKSVEVDIDGDNAYGQLRGEHGVHRLVRLSPFNADNLRQTSFAKVDVLPKIDQPADLAIDEKDLKIDVFRSGGHGGQSVNTTDSAVRATHLPTGLSVAIQNERSQLQNKETALTILRSKLAQLQLEQHKEKLSELKGPNQSAQWGNQIRSYVLHPYKQVKDLRTKYESKDPNKVLDGDLEGFIEAYQEIAPEA
ncbi:MAG TPA: peptide chain release factor 2 [Candidatus Saccharimonadales bacterium]|nr:peptide chain release factor 2 [Candidatus Saccharimonadales bacterium]